MVRLQRSPRGQREAHRIWFWRPLPARPGGGRRRCRCMLTAPRQPHACGALGVACPAGPRTAALLGCPPAHACPCWHTTQQNSRSVTLNRPSSAFTSAAEQPRRCSSEAWPRSACRVASICWMRAALISARPPTCRTGGDVTRKGGGHKAEPAACLGAGVQGVRGHVWRAGLLTHHRQRCGCAGAVRLNWLPCAPGCRAAGKTSKYQSSSSGRAPESRLPPPPSAPCAPRPSRGSAA